MMSNLIMSRGKISDFLPFLLFGFTLVIKLRNFNFESHLNTLIFLDKKMYDVKFDYVSRKNIWFWFISIFLVHFSHKTEGVIQMLSSFLIIKWWQIDYVLSSRIWFALSFVFWVEFCQLKIQSCKIQILILLK